MIQPYLTVCETGERLQAAPAIQALASATPPSPTTVWVNTERRFQTVLGFGGAFTESSAHNWLKLSPAQRDEVLRLYFDRATGHGYTLCRVHMNSCDFSLGNYAHAATPGDLTLQDFSK